MTILSRYKGLPVSVKLLSPLLIMFLSLWTAGTVGFGYVAKNNSEATARKKTADLAFLLQRDLQQRQELLRLKARWISEESSVVKAVSSGDRALLFRTLLPLQVALELDLIRIRDTDGQSLVSLQHRSLNRAVLGNATLDSVAQTGLEVSGIILAEDAAPAALVSFISIKSFTEILANLIVGITVDDLLLQQFRGDTSMHLVAFQGDRITASTLPLDRNQPWQAPQPDALPIRMKIADETYLIKTVELSGFEGEVLKLPYSTLSQIWCNQRNSCGCS